MAGMSDAETESLVNLGLTGYEASAYLALTRRGRATGAVRSRTAIRDNRHGPWTRAWTPGASTRNREGR